MPFNSPSEAALPDGKACRSTHAGIFACWTGPCYYERYRRYFASVEIWSSGQFPAEYQLFNCEDRTVFPTALSPLRTPMAGNRRADYVPVCVA